MLDWIRYFPLRIRDIPDPVTPSGPYFKKLRPQKWLIGDNNFHFSIPLSNKLYDIDFSVLDPVTRSPGKRDLLEDSLREVGRDQMPNKRWQASWFFCREWFFLGPWFAGSKAILAMRAEIVGQQNHQDYINSSFFHPRVFENVIADYLNSYYGHEKQGKKPYYSAPHNWKPINISKGGEVEAASFGIHDISISSDAPVVYPTWYFPVSNNRFIKIMFDYYGLIDGQSRIDMAPMHKLVENISNTFSLEVGSETLKEVHKARGQSEEMSLTKEFGKLKWPVDKKGNNESNTNPEFTQQPDRLSN